MMRPVAQRIAGTFALLLAMSGGTLASSELQRRKLKLSDSDVRKIAGKVPSDLILLIGVAMGFAILCLLLAVFNIRKPQAGSKALAYERARAKDELRVRGAGKKFVIQRPTHRDTLASNASHESKTHLLSPQVAPEVFNKRPTIGLVGPRLANDQPSRAARGYTFYNKSDLEKLAVQSKDTDIRRPNQHHSLASTLAIPVLHRGYTDGAASDSSSTAINSSSNGNNFYPYSDPESSAYASNAAGGDGYMPQGPRPLPSNASHARHPGQGRTDTTYTVGQFVNHPRRVSSTAAGRISQYGSRSYDRDYTKNLPAPPQLLESPQNQRSYALNSKTSLQRNNTEPRNSPYSSGRNSAAHSQGQLPGYYDFPGHEEEHHAGQTSSSVMGHPLLPFGGGSGGGAYTAISGMTRTRPLSGDDIESHDPFSVMMDNRQQWHDPRFNLRAYG